MEFALNEEQKLLVATVRRFMESEPMPQRDEVKARGFLDPETTRN